MSARLCGKYHYASAEQIRSLAIDAFKVRGGRGITYSDLLLRGLVLHKKQAQDTLKYHLRMVTLFTLADKRPQQYYSTAIKSHVLEKLQKNTPVNHIGVAFPNIAIQKSRSISGNPLVNCLEYLTTQTIENYILPLLPGAPLLIHNMQFKIKISTECYTELNLPSYKKNLGKCHNEIIGNTHAQYVFYSNGTVNVITTCSRNPHKLATEEDRSLLIAFFGQLRDRLITFLMDRHERIVPSIMEWELTECDINRDIKVSDLFHFTALKILVKHLDHLFRIYIKAMGTNTVCRIEETKNPRKTAIEVINDIFNPIEKLERRFSDVETKLSEINDKLERLTKAQGCSDEKDSKESKN